MKGTEDLIKALQENLNKELGSQELTELIKALQEKRDKTRKKEQYEEKRREEERKKKEAEERAKRIQEATCMDLPLDWENVYDEITVAEGLKTNSVPDALIGCLNRLGYVDIEFIASATNRTYKEVIQCLKGTIYQNPEKWGACFYKGWETADEYLSGNLIEKWNVAKRANIEYAGYFQDNLHAIERVLPPSVQFDDIYITLGTPWLPTDVVEDFIKYILDFKWTGKMLVHDESIGTWEYTDRASINWQANHLRNVVKFGTSRISAIHIIERMLNMQTIKVMDEVSTPFTKSGKKRVLNEKETMLAESKAELIRVEFKQWLALDKARKERLQEIYETRFGCIRKRTYDGSFLTFPNINPDIVLYPHQKNAVARILFSPNVLLAHEVGAGKTYVMVAAGMELRRLGISKRNLYVVPNNIVLQWEEAFHTLYPSAKLLTITPTKFSAAKRQSVLKAIRDKDYDAIIIPYSSFSMIPMSKASEEERIRNEIEEITQLQKKSKTTKRLDQKLEKLRERLFQLTMEDKDAEDELFFDSLGITTMFVDEAHNFKNLPLDSQTDNVLGISKTGSPKCQDMLDKVLYIQRTNGGRGIVFATGTPITNSISDVYVMQRYLQGGTLAVMDLSSFDAWIGNFAELTTNFEVDVDTNNYRMARRFSKFHNLPELTAILSMVSDFYMGELEEQLPFFDEYTDCRIQKNGDLKNYLKEISKRADDVRKGKVPRSQDNMLKITTDGRKAALDVRLAMDKAQFSYQSKVYSCAENVWNVYCAYNALGSTQLVFCDTSTPKDSLNMYDELKRLLIAFGMPDKEIAYIHEATTDKAREAIFERMRTGKLRVLIGSTWKLGLGVNVQKRLIALHHLDVPWRPADMVQREGRIIRQGNDNKQVYIYRYITDGSFDAYSWQLLETKQRFIADLLSGSLTQRCGNDVGDTVLNYAEIKALAIGNPLVKERVERANELSRLVVLQRRAEETRIRLQTEYNGIPERIQAAKERLGVCLEDKEHVDLQTPSTDKEWRKEFGEKIICVINNNAFETQETEIGEYLGFKILAPLGMRMDKPYIILERAGRYEIEVKESALGVMIRMDNFVRNFDLEVMRREEIVEKLKARREDLKEELSKRENYSDGIAELVEKIRNLDKKLGVEEA